MVDKEYSVRPALEEFEEVMPPHVCDRENCEHGEGFYLLVTVSKDADGDEEVSVQSGAHRADPVSIVQAFIQMIDQSMLDTAEGLPPVLAIARGRELLKQMAEQVEPPADASADLSALLDRFISEAEAEAEDRGERGE
jgi:hypothetical protein